jgi:hypothetical protein
MTEQNKIKVEFKITELLHLHDQLTQAYDGHVNDPEQKAICEYLQDIIWKQIPEFTESDEFYKSIVPEEEYDMGDTCRNGKPWDECNCC